MTLLLSALGVWSAAGQGFDLSTVLPCGTSSPAFPEMGYVFPEMGCVWGMYFQRWGMYGVCISTDGVCMGYRWGMYMGYVFPEMGLQCPSLVSRE